MVAVKFGIHQSTFLSERRNIHVLDTQVLKQGFSCPDVHTEQQEEIR